MEWKPLCKHTSHFRLQSIRGVKVQPRGERSLKKKTTRAGKGRQEGKKQAATANNTKSQRLKDVAWPVGCERECAHFPRSHDETPRKSIKRRRPIRRHRPFEATLGDFFFFFPKWWKFEKHFILTIDSLTRDRWNGAPSSLLPAVLPSHCGNFGLPARRLLVAASDFILAGETRWLLLTRGKVADWR